MKGIKVIIFDFGNVIAYFDHKIACKKLLLMSSIAKFNEEAIYKVIFEKNGIEEQYDKGVITEDQFISKIRVEFSISSAKEDIIRAWSDIFSENEDVIELIPCLKKNRYRLLLASNTNDSHFKKIQEQFKEVLQHFDDTTLSYAVRERKPNKIFFNDCLEKAGVQASECLFIDDKKEYVKAARKFGMVGIHYQTFGKLLINLELQGVNVYLIDTDKKDDLLGIYKEKYLNFRHFDILRWRIFGLTSTVSVAIIGFASNKEVLLSPIVPVVWGIFTGLCSFLIFRINKNMIRNTYVIRQIARKIGDHSIPLSPFRWGAMYWIVRFTFLMGLLLFVWGVILLYKLK